MSGEVIWGKKYFLCVLSTKIWRFLVNFLLQEQAGQWQELCSGAWGGAGGLHLPAAGSDREETSHGHPLGAGNGSQVPSTVTGRVLPCCFPTNTLPAASEGTVRSREDKTMEKALSP